MVTNRDDVSIAIRSAFLKKGVQQKFSFFALVITSIIFLYLDTFQNKPLDFLRATIKDLIYRGSTIVSLPEKGLNNLFTSIEGHFNVIDENIKLKKENRKLKNVSNENNYLLVENLQLKKQLNQEISSGFTLRNAKVIIDKNSPFLKSIIINKGSREKIKKGMAVLDGKNFVGRVVEVNFFSSRVLLVTDLNSKIPIVVEPKGYQAILSGTPSGIPGLDFLPKNHELKTGDKIFTSGKDGVFSSGIPIGQVFLEEDKVFVNLFSDITQLSYVNVDFEELPMGSE